MAEVDIRIRAATIGDADLIADIGTKSFREAYAPHSSAADLESHISGYFAIDKVSIEIDKLESGYLLAIVDGEAGGIAKFRHAPCPVPGGDENAFELQQLYVLAAKQGHGLGWRLVKNVVDAASQAEAKGIWLSAWEFADWATGFYEKVGFAEIGKVDFKLGEMTHNDLLMWMSLD